MRIEKTDMEFVTFDAQDVIMTSTTTGGNDDDMLNMIWLSDSSIDNFNALRPDGSYSLNKGDYDGWVWIAFSGAVAPKKNPEYFSSVAGQDDAPLSGIYTVSSGNQTEYDAVLSWLNKHSGQ